MQVVASLNQTLLPVTVVFALQSNKVVRSCDLGCSDAFPEHLWFIKQQLNLIGVPWACYVLCSMPHGDTWQLKWFTINSKIYYTDCVGALAAPHHTPSVLHEIKAALVNWLHLHETMQPGHVGTELNAVGFHFEPYFTVMPVAFA